MPVRQVLALCYLRGGGSDEPVRSLSYARREPMNVLAIPAEIRASLDRLVWTVDLPSEAEGEEEDIDLLGAAADWSRTNRNMGHWRCDPGVPFPFIGTKILPGKIVLLAEARGWNYVNLDTLFFGRWFAVKEQAMGIGPPLARVALCARSHTWLPQEPSWEFTCALEAFIQLRLDAAPEEQGLPTNFLQVVTRDFMEIYYKVPAQYLSREDVDRCLAGLALRLSEQELAR